MPFFVWLEHSALSTWVRESDSIFAYDLILTCHALGMAAIVGLSAAFALRVLGFARSVPIAPLKKDFPIMFGGFWVNAVSGLLLFIAYPVRAVTNPGFYIKLTGILLAVLTLRRLRSLVFDYRAMRSDSGAPSGARGLAGALLFFWWGAILAGRLMAYHDVANVERQGSIAVITASALMLLSGYVGARVLGPKKIAHRHQVNVTT